MDVLAAHAAWLGLSNVTTAAVGRDIMIIPINKVSPILKYFPRFSFGVH